MQRPDEAERIAAGVLKHPDWVADVVVSGDGRVALTCCDDGKVRLWSLVDAKVLRTIEPPTPETTRERVQ